MISDGIEAPKGVINKIGQRYERAITEFTSSREIITGKDHGRLVPRPYQIIIYNGKLIIIDKFVSDGIQVEECGNYDDKNKLANKKTWFV